MIPRPNVSPSVAPQPMPLRGLSWLMVCVAALAVAPPCLSAAAGAEPPWFEGYRKAADSLAAERPLEAAPVLLETALSTPDPDFDSALFAITLWIGAGDHGAATRAFDRTIDAGLRDAELVESLPAFTTLRQASGWDDRVARIRAAQSVHRAAMARPELFDELSAMWRRDQSAHEAWSRATANLGSEATAAARAAAFAPLEAVLIANQTRFTEIVATVGWPGRTLVGDDGAGLAWSLAQHAPSVARKRMFLRQIAAALAQGEVPPNHYAELHDRIARDTWQRQRFGASWGQDGPHPIVDESRVDERRARLGLRMPTRFYGSAHDAAYRVPSAADAEASEDASRQAAAAHLDAFWKAVAAIGTDEELGAESAAEARARRALIAASKYHGDVTDETLFRAACALAGMTSDSSRRMSLRVLDVLVGRQWNHRFAMMIDPRFEPLRRLDAWGDLEAELARSAPR